MAASTNGSGPCCPPLRLFPPRRVLPWREPFPPFLLDFGDVESLFGFFLVLTVVFQQEGVHQSVVQIGLTIACILNNNLAILGIPYRQAIPGSRGKLERALPATSSPSPAR